MITIKDMIEKPTDNTPIIGNNVSTLKPTETFFIELCLHQSNRQARKWPLATFCRMSSSPWLSRRTPGNARHIYSVLRHREPSHEPVNTCRTLIQSVDVFGDQLFQHQCSWIYTIIICRKPLITSTIRYISCIHLCALESKVLQGFREARSILILPGGAAAERPVPRFMGTLWSNTRHLHKYRANRVNGWTQKINTVMVIQFRRLFIIIFITFSETNW